MVLVLVLGFGECGWVGVGGVGLGARVKEYVEVCMYVWWVCRAGAGAGVRVSMYVRTGVDEGVRVLLEAEGLLEDAEPPHDPEEVVVAPGMGIVLYVW